MGVCVHFNIARPVKKKNPISDFKVTIEIEELINSVP